MAVEHQQEQRRSPGRRFTKGMSGNPCGRVPGSRNRATMMAEKIMESGAEEITSAVVAAGARGDMTAARIVLERLVPLRRGRPVAFPLRRVEKVGDVVAALGDVADAVSTALLTPEEAHAVAAIIELKRRAIETVELERRLRALEEVGARR